MTYFMQNGVQQNLAKMNIPSNYGNVTNLVIVAALHGREPGQSSLIDVNAAAPD